MDGAQSTADEDNNEDPIHDQLSQADHATGHKLTIEGNVQIKRGDFIGRDQNIYGDVHHYHAPTFRPPLRPLFDPLLASYTQLFAGRDPILSQIQKFTRQPEGGYLVITAPAGFGKTALMANLAATRDFAYHFFDTTYVKDGLSEDIFFRNVLQQIATWHSEREQLWMQVDSARGIHDLSALYYQWLGVTPSQPHTILLDGLDEVQAWRLAPYLSLRLPKNLHIVVTIREVGQDWVKEYGFPKEQVTRLPLAGLDQSQVAQVFVAAGGNAAALADDALALNQIMQAALYEENPALGADPFYVRILAEDVRDEPNTLQNIGSQPRGLADYLDRWLNQLKLRAKSEPGSAQAVWDLLGTLVAALGPISRADLEALHLSLRIPIGILRPFPEIVSIVRRFVIGDDTRGYALMHPRLRRYMRDHSDVDVDAYHEKLMDYCACWQEHASPYALAYYARHLAESKKNEELYQLIAPSWMDLKFRRTLSHLSFAEDVQLAVQTAQAEMPINWVQLIRGSLLYARLGFLSTNVSPELLRLIAELGQTRRAEEYATMMQDPEKCSTAFAHIAITLFKQSDITSAQRCLEQALAVARTIRDEPTQAKALSMIMQALAAGGELEQALAVARTIRDESIQAEAFRKIAQALVAAGEKVRAVGVAEEALSAARTIPHDWGQASVLSAIAQALAAAGEKAKSVEVLEEALGVARTIRDVVVQTSAFSNIAASGSSWPEGNSAILHSLSSTFVRSQRAGYGTICDILSTAAPVIAAIDHGKTLWQVYQAITEIESWWTTPPSLSPQITRHLA